MLSEALVNGRRSYIEIAPGLPNIIKGRKLRLIIKIFGISKKIKNIRTPEAVGKIIGKMIFKRILPTKAIKNNFSRVKKYTPSIKLGASMKSWPVKSNERTIRKMKIMYHDAHKAGKHIDIHLGDLSLIMRITGKEVEKKIKLNNKGQLTVNSKKAIIKHIKKEIANNSRVPQNHDHTVANAGANWTKETKGHYGAGKTRQLVAEEDIEIIGNKDKTINYFIPMFNKKTQVYIYKIYDKKETPICIIGNRSKKDPVLKDRLHLKMENDIEKFKAKVDPNTATEKYDGAACHIVTTGSKSIPLRMFSPRIGKEGRIEYTNKLPEFQKIKDNKSFRAMGELRFFKKTLLGRRYLSSAEVGGVLNSNKVRSSDIYPDIRLYRADRFGKLKISNIGFNINRVYQHMISDMLHKDIKVASKIKIVRSKTKEGIVAVPEGKSVNKGYKIKWKADPIDMKITSVDFYITEKNRVAGTIECEYNNKKYYFGPGQLGNRKLCEKFMKGDYIGRHIKTQGFLGGEARASRIIGVHTDK